MATPTTTQTQPHTTLNTGVSQSILKKAPRFFGSPQSILAELFQNSFRAGAKTVMITWDKETRVLQFKDDGCGCKPTLDDCYLIVRILKDQMAVNGTKANVNALGKVSHGTVDDLSRSCGRPESNPICYPNIENNKWRFRED